MSDKKLKPWLFVTMIWFLAGCGIHLTFGNEEFWYAGLWYIWMNGLLVGLLFLIYYLIPVSMRWIIRPALYYAICRLIWEIINPFTDIEINNPWAVRVSFLVALIGAVALLFRDLIEDWKQSQ